MDVVAKLASRYMDVTGYAPFTRWHFLSMEDREERAGGSGREHGGCLGILDSQALMLGLHWAQGGQVSQGGSTGSHFHVVPSFLPSSDY